jgi:serine/threonine-protein kinase
MRSKDGSQDKRPAPETAAEVDAAVKAALAAGGVEEAARVLAANQRVAEAGRVLLTSLGVDAARVGQLDPAKRRRAFMAAIYLARARETSLAVDLFLALGERERAIEALEQAGDQVGAALLQKEGPRDRPSATPSLTPLTPQRLEAAGQFELALKTHVQLGQYAEAARLARQLGRSAEAAKFYSDAGQALEAAACYFEAGDLARCLDSLVRVPRSDPRYRAACVEVVYRANEADAMSLEVDNFLAEFIRTGPQGEPEPEAFYRLGRLFLRRGFPENAREVFAKLVRAKADYRDAAELLAETERALPSAPTVEDLPDLPELPQLPSPTLSSRPAISRPAQSLSDEAEPSPGPIFVVGATVAGRYRLNENIGHGGMSMVFRATDMELGEEIALKVFTQLISEEEIDTRFKRELKLSRQLSHPNIIRLFDIGLYFGLRYITMELLSGTDLSKRISASSPLQVPEVVDYLIQACAALQVAHDQGIIHRDVKPGNFFITSDGIVKVMDFGIAKMQSAPGLTATGLIAGTPAYMSPEQITNFSGVTPSTDLYGLGVVAYEALTGSLPFHHSEVMSLLMMHLKDPPPAPRSRNPAIPEELDRVILKLLEKQPSRRYASCRELQQELQAIRCWL